MDLSFGGFVRVQQLNVWLRFFFLLSYSIKICLLFVRYFGCVGWFLLCALSRTYCRKTQFIWNHKSLEKNSDSLVNCNALSTVLCSSQYLFRYILFCVCEYACMWVCLPFLLGVLIRQLIQWSNTLSWSIIRFDIHWINWIILNRKQPKYEQPYFFPIS